MSTEFRSKVQQIYAIFAQVIFSREGNKSFHAQVLSNTMRSAISITDFTDFQCINNKIRKVIDVWWSRDLPSPALKLLIVWSGCSSQTTGVTFTGLFAFLLCNVCGFFFFFFKKRFFRKSAPFSTGYCEHLDDN